MSRAVIELIDNQHEPDGVQYRLWGTEIFSPSYERAYDLLKANVPGSFQVMGRDAPGPSA